MINRYYDNAATTQMSDGALEIYSRTVRDFSANPSSAYQAGKLAHKELERQREKVASLFRVESSEIFFTSGATESNSIALHNLLWKKKRGTILVSALEHPSIARYKAFFEDQGFTWKIISAPEGYVNPQQLAQQITSDCVAVFVLLVHNILGTVQQIEEISSVVKEKEIEFNCSIHLHCDISQAVGKIDFSLNSLQVDTAGCSAHKFEGPRGTGVLYVRNRFPLRALSNGGNQENGLRPGTQALPSISAMAYALEQAMESDKQHLKALRTRFEQSIRADRRITMLSPSIHGSTPAAPNIISIADRNVPSEVFTRLLYDKGYALSTTSACSNNSRHAAYSWPQQISGFDKDLTRGAFRLSFSRHHTFSDIDTLVSDIADVCSYFNR
ncbi:MAG: aminotransferase class V-fold PLP-dependent enzyme [Sphaerochaetaceae bacterium]|nr:aminotransferase class V-fold PLP-dependent enzyme [Sphaerochaetaceae bacterium]